MTGGIYVLQDNGELVEMTEHAYDSEALLQELLARYPNLLAGDQIDPATPRRWLLVRREAGVPSEDKGSHRWAVDHLFLDQDAVPTLVEVKRSSDTRIRREVVGQMLDYAANAVVYWPVEAMRTEFESRCAKDGLDPDSLVSELVGPERTAEDFWSMAKTNLGAGKIRMIFVADVVPSELRRIVEFLNGQMDPAQVLAVEIRQYVGSSLKTLVPRIIGLTAEAGIKKNTGGATQSRQWDEDSFFSELERRRGAAEAGVARAILAWAKEKGLRIWWGKGNRDGSFSPMFDHAGVTHYLISVWTYGRASIQFQWMMKPESPFADESRRRELLDRINAIPGISIPSDRIGFFPSVPLAVLQNSSAREQFLATLDWVIEKVSES